MGKLGKDLFSPVGGQISRGNLHENGEEKLRESERNSSIDIQDFFGVKMWEY